MSRVPNQTQTFSSKAIVTVLACTCFFVIPVCGQQKAPTQSPLIVQPGAPGQPTKTLPASTRAKLPPISAKDIEFMQGMIVHHAQAVEMVALMSTRTQNKELRLLGARISHTQAEEMRFMERWLKARGQSTSMPAMHHMHGANMSGHHQMLMPGMLTPDQMEALKKAKGPEFDRLFLTGMIQHHGGALDMVKDLVELPGTAQDSEIFNFITDIDTSQRAEIKIMQTMLGEKPKQEKQ